MGNTVLLTHSSGRSEKEEKKRKNTVFKPKNMTSIAPFAAVMLIFLKIYLNTFYGGMIS